MQGVSTPGSAWSLDEAPTHRVERRSAERTNIEVEVSLSSESQFFAGLTGDVSSGGLFVQTYQCHPVGSRVVVMFSLPTGELRMPGVVRWTRRGTETTTPGVGIAFEALTSEQRASIDEFCKGRAPLYHDVESD